MTMQRILTLVILAFPFSCPVYADRNLAGDDIIVLSEPIRDSSIDPSTQFSSRLQNDPVLNYVPELASSQPGHSAAELAQVSTDNLWQRIRNGYGMPEVDSPYTATHEAWYAARPDYVRRMVERSQRYLYHVVVEVEKRGMPTEIALLPMVESAFNPQAYSKSHASGIWQFIPSTGKNFGLKQDWWVDSRRDVTAATDAALTYLQKLHLMFGTWDLALAAYNAGEGTVSRAIARNRQQGLPTDYNSLPLPPETRNYVPKLQAVKNIMTNPELYGLDIKTIPNRPYFTKVTAPQQIDAHLAAKLAEISFDEFSSLNPEYNRPVLTASGSAHEILLPIGAAETFKTNLEGYDKPLVSWQTYHAKRGERMANIARKFGIPLAELRNVNDLPTRDNLMMARPLLVPMDNAGKADANIVMAEHVDIPEPASAQVESVRVVRYKVSNTDSLLSIAKRYKLSTQQLMAQNQLKSSKLKAGQILNVASAPAPVSKAVIASAANRKPDLSKSKLVASKKKQHYVVKRGDTLESIARKFDVARDELQRWNKISGSRIVPGAILMVAKPDQA
ncbi:MAG TPA: LysM peptidoglycan-binding domain-containing protein [Methylovorus sp.]|jgi:membrane-bound lytic murein transglycosylase D|nr:LysM peptidoglycan-binding domain-containing protein [Methylovorus sp.]